ncbi:MAG TPA: FAD binding domain-containing protein [Pyrinomonadaceae bacterium]|nr:FAD binding domain-containing protein [Pyrinomonadaceae bacterium]
MKPPLFDYYDPTELDEALSLLADHDLGAKVLAGGQSLMALLKSRRMRPGALVDINRIAELHCMNCDHEGLRVGATVRQRELSGYEGLAEVNPLLAEALPLIGHAQTRSRGTVCGSLAHADPAAELPAVAITQGASFTVQSKRGQRIVSARKFFQGPHTTIMDHDEMLTHVMFPSWNYDDGWAIEEVGRRPGDFALAGMAVLLTPDKGICARARITVFGADAPRRSNAAETMLAGNALTSSLLEAIVTQLQTETRPQTDIHATAGYRKHLIGVLARRTLRRAAKTAGLLKD